MTHEPIFVDAEIAVLNPTVDATLASTSCAVEAELDSAIVGDTPEFDGDYEYTPSDEIVTVPCIGKKMTRDLVINPISAPYIIPYGTKSITENGNGIDVTQYASVDVNVPSSQPLGNISQRYDATLVTTWKADRKVVADDRVTLPAYSTNAQTLVAAENFTSQTVDNENYCYEVVYRGAIIPIYNTTVQVQGRQEYTVCVALCEAIYNPANTFPSLNGSGVYVASAPTPTAAGFAQHNRHIYWNSATNMSIYNAGTYGATIGFAAATLTSTKITVASPTIGVRGQTTYMKQSVYETITDIRYQYIIELWRVPRPHIGLQGFYFNNIDMRLASDLAGATHTIT